MANEFIDRKNAARQAKGTDVLFCCLFEQVNTIAFAQADLASCNFNFTTEYTQHVCLDGTSPAVIQAFFTFETQLHRKSETQCNKMDWTRNDYTSVTYDYRLSHWTELFELLKVRANSIKAYTRINIIYPFKWLSNIYSCQRSNNCNCFGQSSNILGTLMKIVFSKYRSFDVSTKKVASAGRGTIFMFFSWPCLAFIYDNSSIFCIFSLHVVFSHVPYATLCGYAENASGIFYCGQLMRKMSHKVWWRIRKMAIHETNLEFQLSENVLQRFLEFIVTCIM